MVVISVVVEVVVEVVIIIIVVIMMVKAANRDYFYNLLIAP